MISIFVSLLNGFFLKGSSNFCSQSEVMLLFVPNDPKSDLKLKVQTHNIKSKCLIIHIVHSDLSWIISLNDYCAMLNFSGQKYTKEGSNKPPWLNLTSKQVVFPRPFLLKAKKYW